MNENQLSLLEQLPYELKTVILCSADDFISLRNVITASRSFYDVFQDQRATIARSVFDTLIHPSLHDEAVENYLSSDTTIRHADNCYLSEWHYSRAFAARKADLLLPLSREFWSIVRFHNSTIVPLARHVTRSVFQVAEAKGWSCAKNEKPLATEERIRIQRALYRIQIYTNLFPSPSSSLHARDSFLLAYPAWEIDELGCVYDYLAIRTTFLFERTTELHLDTEERWYAHLFEESMLRCISRSACLSIIAKVSKQIPRPPAE